MRIPEGHSPIVAAPFAGRATVLVAGGAGFLGSHLCERLVGEGHEVVCLDNFDTGRSANVAHLAASPRFYLLEHDILNPVPEALPRFDQIYNLACPASPVHYQRDAVKTALVCAQGTLNLLQRARRDGAWLLHASTSEIYGDPEQHPQPEHYWGNVNTVGPRSCYDEGKRFAETLVTDFSRQMGLSARIVRIFNTYGPRMQFDDGRVVSNFIVQALRGMPLTLYGDGSQTRSFCYVDDLIEGFVRAMASGAAMDRPVNLGNPEEYRVRDLAETIIAMTGSSSAIVHMPLPVDDPRRRRPDISRAMEFLGWSPRTSLAVGLEATIAEFATRLVQGWRSARPELPAVAYG
ncbi:MAG TPA: SDR family oxidoreductase [Aquamicrobium sp.]|nr:SDR family oxidoreductase [Aquamicrobium sp.]